MQEGFTAFAESCYSQDKVSRVWRLPWKGMKPVPVGLLGTHAVALDTAPLERLFEQPATTSRCHGPLSSLGNFSLCRESATRHKGLCQPPGEDTAESMDCNTATLLMNCSND